MKASESAAKRAAKNALKREELEKEEAAFHREQQKELARSLKAVEKEKLVNWHLQICHALLRKPVQFDFTISLVRYVAARSSAMTKGCALCLGLPGKGQQAGNTVPDSSVCHTAWTCPDL